jgi:hypothetical protein
MTFQQRVAAWAQIGKIMGAWVEKSDPVIQKAYIYNPWFTEENVKKALLSWADQLQENKLNEWTAAYVFPESPITHEVAIIMAGNIPLVGLHDLICVTLCGYKALIKCSSDDQVLIKQVVETMLQVAPEMGQQILITEERLPKSFDTVIATGSNNTNRYFEYYFKGKPHLLRKNRSSIAVLNGNETPEDLQKLGDDLFSYFGLGCRNISKLYVPEGYDFTLFFENLERHHDVINHNKYANNYTYHKAIFLMNLTKHLDNGFLLVKEDKAIASPLSCLFYETYTDKNALEEILVEHQEEIQCISGKTSPYIPFGQSQQPELWDYADGVDTLEFLLKLA